MSLIETVSKGIVDAMKAKDSDVLGTLRMLKTALTMREVEKGRGLEPAEELMARYGAETLEEAFFAATGREFEEEEDEDDDREVFA